MGMYTELDLTVALRLDTPYTVQSVLRGGEVEESEIPTHRFFEAARWHQVTMGGGSYYFHSPPRRSLFKDPLNNFLTYTMRTNLKNYDSEIEKFLDFLTEYIDTKEHFEGDFVGYSRYEERTEPTLLYTKRKLNSNLLWIGEGATKQSI